MNNPLPSRPAWILGIGIASAGLFGTAAFAGTLSSASLPTQASAHASSAPSSDTSEPTDTSDTSEPSDSSDTSEPSQSSDSSASGESSSGAPSSTPVGPDASGPAAFGLCTAYEHAKVHGKSVSHSIAFRNLAAAAGGADMVDAYCATIVHPGSSEPSSSSSDTEASPSVVPSHSHRSGRPSSVPSHSHP